MVNIALSVVGLGIFVASITHFGTHPNKVGKSQVGILIGLLLMHIGTPFLGNLKLGSLDSFTMASFALLITAMFYRKSSDEEETTILLHSGITSTLYFFSGYFLVIAGFGLGETVQKILVDSAYLLFLWGSIDLTVVSVYILVAIVNRLGLNRLKQATRVHQKIKKPKVFGAGYAKK